MFNERLMMPNVPTFGALKNQVNRINLDNGSRLNAKGSHQKKQEKNFTTVVNYLQKWKTPLISQQFQPLSELEN